MITTFKAGDILGFSGNGWISHAINAGTYGLFGGCSHVGFIFDFKWQSKYLPNDHDVVESLCLAESTSLSDLPCVIKCKKSSGVQAHLVRDINTYDGRIYHYPCVRELYGQERRRLTKLVVNLAYAPYDTVGAMRSAGVFLSTIEGMRGQDTSSLFCSEFTAFALTHIGLWTTANASKWSPNRLIRRLRNDGIIGRPRRLK